jgi:hypothetical protein
VADRVALKRDFSPKFRLSFIIIILPMCHIHLQLHVALTKRPMFEPWGPPENNTFSKIGEHWIEKYFVFRVSLLPVVTDDQ